MISGVGVYLHMVRSLSKIKKLVKEIYKAHICSALVPANLRHCTRSHVVSPLEWMAWSWNHVGNVFVDERRWDLGAGVLHCYLWFSHFKSFVQGHQRRYQSQLESCCRH